MSKEIEKSKKSQRIKCSECGREEEIMFLHSKCCNAHFEGIIDLKKKKRYIVCEKCGKFVAELK